MEINKREEIWFLQTLQSLKKGQPTHYSRSEIIEKIYHGKMKPERAEEIFGQFMHNAYLDERDDPNNTSKKIYAISDSGGWYLEILLNEKDSEELDLKLKKINIGNIGITRQIAIWALIVSGLGLGFQVVKYIMERKEYKSNTIINRPEQRQLPEEIELKNSQTIPKTILYPDSTSKK